MRKLFSYLFLLLLASVFGKGYAQDFSNKGIDFWVGYGYHVNMAGSTSNSQEMVLYFATDQATNVTVEIPILGYSKSYSIPANTSFTTDPLPKTGLYDATLKTEGLSDKGIHIKSDKPIVAYTHIYNSSVSGATLLFPTPTLGREYFSVNYTQVSNAANSNCWFYVVAVDTGTTSVEITPSAATLTHTANLTFTVNLKQGQVYNVMGQVAGGINGTFKGVDLTGSVIKSVSTGATGCKRIAVFSGSGKLSLTCNNEAGSSDNYIVQAFPKNAWGKKYLTAPTRTLPNNFFRICVSDPTAVVKVNGAVLSGLINNFYYDIKSTPAPLLIEGDKPVLVAQYITTQSACGNGSPGDPEIIYLSPVEQSIDKVVLNSTPNFNITQHWINVIMKNSGTASFTIDGNPTTFTPHPEDPSYAYAQIRVTQGPHTIQADSGFNAIAYGFGNAESYGYNAGTNVKDLYQFVSIKNQYATVSYPAGCRASPFYLSITFPYQPTQIRWNLSSIGKTDVTLTQPVFDSTWQVNGKQLYLYRLPTPYIVNSIGNYPITIIAQNTSSEGCTGEQEVKYDLQIFERPTTTFDFTTNGCLGDKVQFSSSSVAAGQKITLLSWDLDDGTSMTTDKFEHVYAKPATYNVKLAIITEIGCVSDTISKPVTVTAPPEAKFDVNGPYCTNKVVTFTDASSVAPPSKLVKWYWDFGDNSTPVVATSSGLQTHTYTTAGNFTVTLKVETAAGCVSPVFSKVIAVRVNPQAGFIVPANCLNDVVSKFTDTAKISDGTAATLSYQWNFGDANATVANPNDFTGRAAQHKYITVGSYNVKQVVTSAAGCADSVTQVFVINGANPVAGFSFSSGNTVCSNKQVTVVNSSTVDFGSISRLEIYWDYANDPSNKTTALYPPASAAYTNKYPEFYTPANKAYDVRVVAYSGDACVSQTSKVLTLNNTPDVYFTAVTPVCADVLPFNIATAGVRNTIPGTGVFSGTGVNASGLFNPATAKKGTDSLLYTYTAANGCVSAKKGAVTVYAVPVADAGPDQFVLEGGATTLLAKASGTGLSYLWSPASYLNSNTVAQPVVTPLDDITYTFKVTSADGCSASDNVTIKLLKTPAIPNVFSPNGDGINDTWVIAYLSTYPGSTVQVYNRYGQVIFEAAGNARPWDGTYKGAPVPAGTYYYIINPKNGRPQFSGYVDIVR